MHGELLSGAGGRCWSSKRERFRRLHGAETSLLAVLSEPLVHHLLPDRVGAHLRRVGGAVSLVVLALCLFRYRHWRRERPHARHAALALLLLLAELALENFAVFAVSSLDAHKRGYRPLQDVLMHLLRTHVLPHMPAYLRMVQGWEAMHYAALLIVSVHASCIDGLPQHGESVMLTLSKCGGTLALSRGIRVLSFFPTIVPNPKPNCYDRKFPPVPETLNEFLRVGFGKARSGGGCNDLIFSGHGTIYTTAVLAAVQARPSLAMRTLSTIAMTTTMLHEVSGQTHYTVDMVLSLAVTWLCWREITRQVEQHDSEDTQERRYSSKDSEAFGSTETGIFAFERFMPLGLATVVSAVALAVVAGGA